MRKTKPVKNTKYLFSRKALDDRGADILNALEELTCDLEHTTPNDLYRKMSTITDDLGVLLSNLTSVK